jgi:3-hydroxymyristoyl/3-hydroxydecanoyl-(acyl carrier protein) dehydratase
VPVDASLAGRTFPATAPYTVTVERVAEFAAAIGTPYAEGDPAPATFPIVVAFAAMQDLMSDPTVGIELHHVVHGEQRFAYERPVQVGDRLTAQLTVESLRQIGGADIIGTSSAVRDADGALVCTAKAVLVHKSDGAVER